MGTRCQIGIIDNNNALTDGEPEICPLIYRHYDGYLGTLDERESGVVPDILPFIKAFVEQRGYFDAEYLGACLVSSLKQNHCGKPIESYEKIMVNGMEIPITGVGIGTEIHGDIEYFYAVLPDRLEVYLVRGCFELQETHYYVELNEYEAPLELGESNE